MLSMLIYFSDVHSLSRILCFLDVQLFGLFMVRVLMFTFFNKTNEPFCSVKKCFNSNNTPIQLYSSLSVQKQSSTITSLQCPNKAFRSYNLVGETLVLSGF